MSESDKVEEIEPLIQDILDDNLLIAKKADDGETKYLSKEEVLESMKDGCNAFWMYKDDIELKQYFFDEVAKLKTEWKCYADEPD